MSELLNEGDLDACLAASETAPIFIFKHSTTCPISAAAYGQVRRYVEGEGHALPVYMVKVIEARPVSNAVAALLGVTHQSPQLILVKGRKALWDRSHGQISVPNIEAAVEAGKA